MATILSIMVCPFCEWSASRTDKDELNKMWSDHLKNDH